MSDLFAVRVPRKNESRILQLGVLATAPYCQVPVSAWARKVRDAHPAVLTLQRRCTQLEDSLRMITLALGLLRLRRNMQDSAVTLLCPFAPPVQPQGTPPQNQNADFVPPATVPPTAMPNSISLEGFWDTDLRLRLTQITTITADAHKVPTVFDMK